MQLTEYEQKSIDKLIQSIYDGKWSNTGMVQLIEQLRPFLNPVTIAQHAKQCGKSYNGIKKTKQTVKIWDVKYIIDNL